MSPVRTPFRDLPTPQQAGILCNADDFVTFIKGRFNHVGSPPEFVRTHCGVKSRRELATNGAAARRFDALVTEYDAWRGAIAPQNR